MLECTPIPTSRPTTSQPRLYYGGGRSLGHSLKRTIAGLAGTPTAPTGTRPASRRNTRTAVRSVAQYAPDYGFMYLTELGLVFFFHQGSRIQHLSAAFQHAPAHNPCPSLCRTVTHRGFHHLTGSRFTVYRSQLMQARKVARTYIDALSSRHILSIARFAYPLGSHFASLFWRTCR